MSINRLSYLLEKYRKGMCTDEEIRELESWYESLHHSIFLNEYDSEEDREKLADEMLMNFKERAKVSAKPEVKKLIPLKQFIRVAAILAGISLAAWFFYSHHLSQNEQSQFSLEPHVVYVKKNQFISLPDGSTVILKADSRLKYTADFGKIN